jgi:hypothetical protein
MLPIFIMLGITATSIIANRPAEEETNKKIDPKKSKDYLSLLNDYFQKHGLYDSQEQLNGDPWSPGLHYIIRKEKEKLLGIIPWTADIAVAEVTSEPEFAEGQMEASKLYHGGLEIRVIDQNVKPVIEEFCRTYKNRFNEEYKITDSKK